MFRPSFKQVFYYIGAWFQCSYGVDSLTYNHCVILVIQAFFHTELLEDELSAG